METLAFLQVASFYEVRADQPAELPDPLGFLENDLVRTDTGKTGRTAATELPIGWKLASMGLSFLFVTSPLSSLALQLGDQNAEVTSLQRRLREVGVFDGPLSGFYGPLTRDAVLRFQRSNRLTADGIAGSATLTALRNVPRGGPTISTTGTVVRPGDRGEAVLNIQRRLQGRDFYRGSIDGIYGANTETAVRQFQSARRLPVDGIVGPTTLAALQQAIAPAPQAPASPAPATNANTSGTMLKSGSTGPAVSSLQVQLRSLEFLGTPVDGIYGSSTEEAVRRFQLSRRITVDGIAGAATIQALNQATIPAAIGGPTINPPVVDSTLRPGQTGAAIGKLQSNLKTLNLYTGPITSVYGPLTVKAVQEFQAQNRLTVDGVAGPATLSLIAGAVDRATAAKNNTLPSNQPKSAGDKLSVLDLQRRLSARGFDPGPLDGNLGPKTDTAIKAAQSYYGIRSTDIASGLF